MVEELIWKKNIIPPNAIITVNILHYVSFLRRVRKAALDNLHVWENGRLLKKKRIYQRYCINVWKLLWQWCLREEMNP